MKPTNTLAGTLATLLAQDANFLAHATLAVKVVPIIAPFVEGVDRIIGDLTLGASGGLAPIAGATGNQLESVDPTTGALIVEVKVPAGGYRWETTAAPGAPINVYGYALTNNAVTTLLGTQALTTPIVLTAINQSFTAPPIVFRIDPNQIY